MGDRYQANQSILDAESAAYLIFNTTTNKYFATGGGFSNYFPRPDYQKDALNEYFHKHDPGYPFYVSRQYIYILSTC